MQLSQWTAPPRQEAGTDSGKSSHFAAMLLCAGWLCAVAAPSVAEHHEMGESVTSEVPVSADAPAATAPNSDESAATVMPLSLADAIALGIENNLAVEIARHDPLIADLDLSVAWSAYDPIISGDAGYRDDRQPPTSSLQGGKTQVLDGSLGATWQLPVWGAEVGVSYGASKTEALGPFTSALPQWDSGLTFNASIPVLRNFIWNAAWLGIKTHEIRVDKSNRTFEDTLIKTIANIETAYWNLVASHEQLNVALKSLESSKALLRQVETQYEVGVVSKVDVVEAEAGVAERDFSLIMATNGYQRAQDTLIDAVLGTRLEANTDLTIEPTDLPEGFTRFEVDVDVAVTKAFAHRPDYHNAKDDLETERLMLKHKRNQMLPQLDLQGSYSATGRGGTGTPIADTFDVDMDGDRTEIIGTNPTTATGIHDTNTNMFGNRGGDVYTARGVVSIPLGNVRARKEATIAEINLRKANTRLLQLKQSIIKDVRDAVRNLRSSLQGIDAAERRRAAAAEQLRAERVRLEHGESTPFDVLQRERDLVDAESQKIGALQTYRLSETSLLRSQGTLLHSRNIVLQDASPLRSNAQRW